MLNRFHAITLALLLCNASIGLAAGEKVFFVEPKDGATVTSPFELKFGIEGMKVRPAGDMTPDTGHYHIIVNGGPIPEGEVIPKDNRHLHYGKGQTEAKLTLPPGDYTLTLQFADGAHKSYGPAMSQTIKVHVQ